MKARSQPHPIVSKDQRRLRLGELQFKLQAISKHNKMGFTPYFDKYIRKLNSPIPLTIFDKNWKNLAILYHYKKQVKANNLSSNCNCYTGFPYPSKWFQTFAKWTSNHQGFHSTLVTKYGYKRFAKWLLDHKANANTILAEDGFMMALRYNIQVRTVCFSYWVTHDNGKKLIANISLLRLRSASSA
jgi:hypothetical protein